MLLELYYLEKKNKKAWFPISVAYIFPCKPPSISFIYFPYLQSFPRHPTIPYILSCGCWSAVHVIICQLVYLCLCLITYVTVGRLV